MKIKLTSSALDDFYVEKHLSRATQKCCDAIVRMSIHFFKQLELYGISREISKTVVCY